MSRTAYRLERTNSGNLSSLAGTTVSSLVCAKYEVGIREQSLDSRSSLAILPMYDPGLLSSFDRRRLRFRLLQRGGTTEVDDRAPAYVDITRHQFGNHIGGSNPRPLDERPRC